MKYIGENAIKKLISLIKGDLATKQPTITASGLLKGDGTGTITAADTQEATLVDVPNGLLKGDGTTISAAVAGTDYISPDGMNEAVAAAKDVFWATFDSTYAEVKAAYDAGKTVKFGYMEGGAKTVLEIEYFDADEVFWFRGMKPRFSNDEATGVYSLERLKLSPNGSWKSPGTINLPSKAEVDSKLSLSGGTLTGNLTGKYITGTWLQTTATTALSSAAQKIAVLDNNGWVYYRTPEQIRSDIGAPAADTKLSLTGGTMTGAISFSGSQESETSKLFWKNGAFCLTTGQGNIPPFKLSSNDEEATLSFGPAITETGSSYYGSSISLKPNGLTISAPGGFVKITDVKNPTSDSDAANKSYVDSVAPTPIPNATITSTWNSVTV